VRGRVFHARRDGVQIEGAHRVLVHGHRGPDLAAPEAAHLADLDAFSGELLARALAEVLPACEPARDVAAHGDVDVGRRRAPEVRIERRHALEPVERHAEPLRRGVKVGVAQVAVLVEKLIQGLDDDTHGRSLTRRWVCGVALLFRAEAAQWH
jgi:hypothetical protein